MRSRVITTSGEQETFALGEELARDLRAGDIVLLRGELGMGKTMLARGLAAGLGVPRDDVHSPTFTLVNPYRGRYPVYHVDLYRIERPAELEELGLEEILGGDGVAIVEWAERLGPYHPVRSLDLLITDGGGSVRHVAITDTRAGYSTR